MFGMNPEEQWVSRIGIEAARRRKWYIASHSLLIAWAFTQVALVFAASSGWTLTNTEGALLLGLNLIVIAALFIADSIIRRQIVGQIRAHLHLKAHVRVPDVCIFRIKAFDYWTRKVR